MANHAAQNGEKISNASAAAAERFRKKEMNSKKKKKIVVEPREQVSRLFEGKWAQARANFVIYDIT